MTRFFRNMPIMNPLWWLLGIILAVAVAFLIGLIVISARYAFTDSDESSLQDSKMNRVFSFLNHDSETLYFPENEPFEIAMPEAVSAETANSQLKVKESAVQNYAENDAELEERVSLARRNNQPYDDYESYGSLQPAPQSISRTSENIAFDDRTQAVQTNVPAIAQSNGLEFDSYNVEPLQEARAPELNFKSEPIIPPDKSHALNPVQTREPIYQGLAQRDFPFKDIMPDQTDPRFVRSVLTYEIMDMEPSNEYGNHVRIKQSEPTRLFWFNEIADAKGEVFYQSWYYQGLLMSRIAVDVRSDEWSASSYKTLLPSQQGEWRVATETLDEEVLSEHSFNVTL